MTTPAQPITAGYGAYTACLHDRTLEEALDVLASVGLTGAEVNVGGFISSPHIPVDELLVSETGRERYLAIFADRDMDLMGLTVSGNPLSPLATEGPQHAEDLRRAIRLAGLLGVDEVVAMSGTPGSDSSATRPSWIVNPWNDIDLDVLDYQWSVLVPFWQEIDALARAHDVRICLELHPRNVVFSPVTYLQFVERVAPTNIAVNLDPSHLFWQQMDPIACLERLGDHVGHVHAKDTALQPGVATRGVLDTVFSRADEDAERTPTGIGHWASQWPDDPAWRFVAVGEGHGVDWWTAFLRAVHRIDPDMHVTIEHEDAAFGRIEGIERSARALLAAADQEIPR